MSDCREGGKPCECCSDKQQRSGERGDGASGVGYPARDERADHTGDAEDEQVGRDAAAAC